MPNRIRELRKKNNEKQESLAKLLNCTQGLISSWENGRYQPDNNSLLILADHFDVSVDYLLGRDGETKKATDELGGEILKGIESLNIRDFNSLSQQEQAVVRELFNNAVKAYKEKK